jgi:DNA-binding HxlR family transcriptional regulator
MEDKKVYNCSVDATLSVIGGRWKSIILFYLLQNKVMRFNQMQKTIPGITQRMLTNQLRELEKDDVVLRKVYAQVPPKVEYSLTDYGKTLEPILVAMRLWGDHHINR